jgi:hypothetical protein
MFSRTSRPNPALHYTRLQKLPSCRLRLAAIGIPKLPEFEYFQVVSVAVAMFG